MRQYINAHHIECDLQFYTFKEKIINIFPIRMIINKMVGKSFWINNSLPREQIYKIETTRFQQRVLLIYQKKGIIRILAVNLLKSTYD